MKKKRIVLIFGAILTTLLMISSSTVIGIEQIDKRNEIADNINDSILEQEVKNNQEEKPFFFNKCLLLVKCEAEISGRLNRPYPGILIDVRGDDFYKVGVSNIFGRCWFILERNQNFKVIGEKGKPWEESTYVNTNRFFMKIKLSFDITKVSNQLLESEETEDKNRPIVEEKVKDDNDSEVIPKGMFFPFIKVHTYYLGPPRVGELPYPHVMLKCEDITPDSSGWIKYGRSNFLGNKRFFGLRWGHTYKITAMHQDVDPIIIGPLNYFINSVDYCVDDDSWPW